jgi:aerotolerance regulator-like protein/VWA domain-containing protein
VTFLTPAFLVGLGALAIPVLVHLIQRERKRVVEFPSLMFVRRIPYQSVRRRRIRHWALLALRAAAIALVVAAFARPFRPQGAAAIAATGGAREVVILLDHSASMGYGDRFARARDAARGVVRSLAPGDRATLVLFAKNAEENMRATSDRARLEAAIGAATVGSGATRFGPAVKLAESILSRSPVKRREAVLISDFQKTGWTGSEEAHFAEGMALSTVPVGSGPTANLSVPSVTFARSAFSGQERVAVTAGLSNKGADALRDVPVALSIDGHEIETVRASVPPRASASVTFTPFTLAAPNVRGSVRAGSDPMPADNVFHFVLTPSAPVSLAVVDRGAADASLFLAHALSIGTTPTFQIDVLPTARVVPASFDKRAVVVLNDTMFPPAGSGGVLKRFVERGGGLLVIAGEHTTWPSDAADLLPGKLGPPVDRTSGPSASLGYLDYSHPVFEIFKAPRSGDFSAAHVFRYRALEPAAADRVLARYDDGAAAAVERKIGSGRVIAWTSTLDDTWTDIAVKPVFLPLVHQLVRYLARYEQPTSWFTVGQVIDLSARVRTNRIVVTPSGERLSPSGNEQDPRSVLELEEQGIYEIRAGGATGGRPEPVAVNLDPAESDLTTLDPRELVAAVTGRATPGQSAAAIETAEVTREETERRQSLWWYLLLAGVVLLAAETVIANHLSRKEKFL